MQILFFGTGAFAIPSLQALVTHPHQVRLCVTQPGRPQGRGLRVLPSPLKAAALGHGLVVEELVDLEAAVKHLQGLEPDVGVVAAYGRLIPLELLKVPKHGMLGVHPSWLPRYRGPSPVAWAIINAEPTTGVTVFRLAQRTDAGDILLQEALPIEPQDTTESLSQRLANLGARLLLEGLDRLERGQASFRPQDERQATSCPKLTKAHGWIDWQARASSIDRLVRAAIPWPGAHTTWRGGLLKLWLTRYDSDNHTRHARPGEVLSTHPEGLVVATGEGKLLIRELQLAGGRRMAVREFLAGHPINVGEILGG